MVLIERSRNENLRQRPYSTALVVDYDSEASEQALARIGIEGTTRK